MQTRALLVAVVIIAAASSTASAETIGVTDDVAYRCQKPSSRLKIAFKPELELDELVTWASGFSCKTIVFSSQVASRKLRINIVAPKKLSARAAWSLFHTALRGMNLALVAKGSVFEVIEAPAGKKHALPLLREKRGASPELARALVSAEFLSGAELLTVLGALASKAGEVTALPGTEMVLVTDYGDHIDKMSELLSEVDRGHAENEGVYVVPIAHADVAELTATIEAILGAKQAAPVAATKRRQSAPVASSGPRSIIAEPRTRSIILVASPPAFRRARSLIKRLDIATGEQSSHIHMIRLEHASSETLATTLSALLSSRPAPAKKTSTARTSGGISVEGDVRVTHDAPTNSLLLLATMSDFLALREIIRRLDTTRRQVYIEAMIMEVSVTGERDLKGSFHFGGEKDGATWLTGLQQKDLQSTDLKTLVGAAGLLGGLFGQPLTGLESFVGQSIPSFGLLFQALATSRRANLLSSPRIMTSDNAEAKIKVSESRRERGATTTVATGGTTQAVETVDASLTLTITPHVNATDEVRLDIDLTVEEFLPSRSEGLGSDKSSREIKNTVVVRDQESVIIGGLVVEREVRTESKVPLLGDIPLLGHLFKSTGTDKEKRNLVVLLTPYILDSRADHDRLVRKKLLERGEFMRAHMQLSAEVPRRDIDYRKKRGLLETINQRAAEIERETAERAKSALPGGPPPSEGPY